MKASHLIALGCGVLFGLGLSIAQMTDPQKVLGFLDVAGRWDPSLAFVLGGAVAVTMLFFRRVARRGKPLAADAFEAPPPERMTPALAGGAALFGAGWGIAGYCPGPGIVSLARLAPDALVFCACFLAGSMLYRAFSARTPRPSPRPFSSETARTRAS